GGGAGRRDGREFRARGLRRRPRLHPELSEFSGHGPGPGRFRSGNMNEEQTVSADFFESNREVLEKAVEATGSRGYWSPFSESPSPRVYGETAAEDGRKAFEALLGKDFPLDLPGAMGMTGQEHWPFGDRQRVLS